MNALVTFLKQEHAATAVEYAVMLALILMATVAAIGAVGAQTAVMYGDIQGEMDSHGIK